MDDLEIRLARDGELGTVAGLRWRWVAEQGDPGPLDRAEFVTRFVAWAREHSASHRCYVVLRAGRVLGMAWLALLPRVPTPRALDRRSGDVQCVYVVPEERDNGVGGRLLDVVLGEARALGLERVTVHSSERAVPAYLRHGFAPSPRLLQTRPG
ncbi:GNAT family N-acetyltransferase [Amycolatopsis sacchari]|uniref:Acetyltransferase (GNAT) domain-containing protein n=1 Tax=Amycolatopsis sacchari TaxID=115433 RepID=A0A1I3JM25_9PSEU|nr:GNAT family N-acetyltransferase [Amycolatopsis sacchari]SFI61322.1 Acetyltransferase (GNAT) domain-containing protein [Amycolatopsis sacchari]